MTVASAERRPTTQDQLILYYTHFREGSKCGIGEDVGKAGEGVYYGIW